MSNNNEVVEVPLVDPTTVGAEVVRAALQFQSEIKYLEQRITYRNNNVHNNEKKDEEEIKDLKDNLEWYKARLNQCFENGLDIAPEDLEELKGMLSIEPEAPRAELTTSNPHIYGPESDGSKKAPAGGGNILNVVVCGPGGVGKSAITVMFTSGHFIEEYDPTIEDNFRKQVSVDGDHTVLEILDTAGQEEYKRMREMWMRPAAGFLLVYAIDSTISYQTIHEWHDQILRIKDEDSFPMILLGNKSDLPPNERTVTTKQGQELAGKWNIPFLETSAKTHTNIEQAFHDLVRFIRRHGSSKPTGGGGGKTAKYGPPGGRLLRCTLF